MFDAILKRMRDKVRTLEYVMTFHAEEEKDADELGIMDIEHCILNGEISERQRDVQTGEWKYRVSGKSRSGRGMDVICKIGPTGKFVVITVYAL